MTKTLTVEQKKKMLSEKYIGVFPLEFSVGKKNADDGEIPDTIQIIPIGQWDHDLYGPIMITATDIKEFAQNFNAGVRKGVFITAGHEGFEELPAMGWITKVEARDTGLWGQVEWNDAGVNILSDKQFKFFSPEFYRDYEDPQTHQLYRNVLIGGALTKSPYFKELQAIVFSEPKLKKSFNTKNNEMNLKDILAKKMEALSAEEQQFLREHKTELTEEQKTAYTSIVDVETAEQKEAREKKEGEDKKAADDKAAADANVAAGLNPDGTAKVAANDGKAGKMIQMSEAEATQLRKMADEGSQAFAKLEASELTVVVKSMIFSETNKAGKVLPKGEAKLRAFMGKLDKAQRAAFSEILADVIISEKFSEVGKGTGAADGTAQAEVEAKITLKMSEAEKAGKPMKYSEALKLVMSENDGLEKRYDEELPSGKRAMKA